MAVHAFPYWHPTIEQNELAIELHKSLEDRLQIEATKRLKLAKSLKNCLAAYKNWQKIDFIASPTTPNQSP